MDAATAAIMQNTVRQEGRSLLQYVGESFPWTTAKNHDTLPILANIVKEEQQGAAAVVQCLVKNRVRPPYLGAYPMSFTTINYMALDYLIPFLVDFEKRRINELERDIAIVTGDDAPRLLQVILDMKRRHLASLQGPV